MIIRTGFVERYGKVEDLDRSLDLEFWQAQPPTVRLAAAWDMIVFAYAVKKQDVRQLGLQRSIESFQRQPG
jgi:hypothetical protein